MNCTRCGADTPAGLCWRCELRQLNSLTSVGSFRPCHSGCGRSARIGSTHCGEIKCVLAAAAT